MRRTKFSIIAVIMIVLGTVFAPLAYAEVQIPAATDGSRGPSAPAPLDSPRLIVELDAPPLAVAYLDEVKGASVNGKLDVNSTTAQAYVSQRQAEQAAFMSALLASMPSATVSTYLNEAGVSVQATYQVVFNGLSITPGMDREQARQRIARLPGVKAVFLDLPYSTQLYTSTQLINAPVAWNNAAIGGRVNAGAGVKLASIDGGVHKDAPMFSGAGYSYPPGYGANGLGLTANNNGKIIASRAYFRPWDPPAPGDENPWPGQNSTPHGVHTAGIAAGGIVTATYQGFNVGAISGVAPRAYVMSYRVFYASVNNNESSYTTEMVAALEDMVDDGADIVNNSWGEGPISEGDPFDPVDTALVNASKAGVFVSMSAGNSGPGLDTTDHPAADYVNVAASTTTGLLATGRLSVVNQPDLQDMAFASAGFGALLPIAQIVEYDYLPSAVADPNNVLGCDPWPAGVFAGKAALIRRGSCEFGVKVLNAEQAGASFVIVYNHTDGGDGLIGMGPGAVGDQITVLAIFIGNTNGEALIKNYNDNGPAAARIGLNTVAFQISNVADRIVSFSSRGPGVGNVLKPDIAAPGVNILSQGYADGVTGEARHLGYGQVSGTSMAAPHVAGAAAVLRQIYPNWSNAAIKSALMSTAKYLDVYNFDETPAQPLDMGAGRLDVGAAVDPGVILDPPSLSFGSVVSGTQEIISVTVTSVAGAPEIYTLRTLYTGGGFTQTTGLPGFSTSASSITLNPGESKTVAVTFDTGASRGYGDNQGYIVMTGANGHKAHMPAWARVTHATKLADVLIIDNDASGLVQDYDYLWYYTRTLDQLGYSYAVWNTDDHAGSPVTIPDATTLGAYKAIMLFTGDNYQPDGAFAISTGLTQLDQDRLVEYLNGGGALIAMGQDLSSALAAAELNPRVGGRNFLYVYRLGANWLQDSVSNQQTPNGMIVPTSTAPEHFKKVVVDLTQPRKYAATGNLLGSSEAPMVTTDTQGVFAIRYDVDQHQLQYAVTIMPTVTAPITVTAAHIHVGAMGVNGPPIRNLFATAGFTQPVFVSSELTLAGIVTPSLTVAETQQMLNQEFYINIYTTVHPVGEIRSQIEPLALPNQPYMDEIDNVFHDGSQEPGATGTSESNLASNLILRYTGPHNVFDGAVAALHRDQPSLERPGTDYSGRSIYASFGLEGVSNDFSANFGITPTSRSALLGAFLDWAWSEPGQVTISNTTPISVTAGGMTFFKATLAASAVPAATQTTAAVSYRWDFGDGSSYTTPFLTPEVGHSYAACGVYTVRTQVTDMMGNVTIGAARFAVRTNCGSQPARQQVTYLPIISKK